MAKIIYKKWMEGQNKLSCIEGIEIDLLNGQKALIYPKYAERPLLKEEQVINWNARQETELEALKIEDTNEKTEGLAKIGSPAADWVLHFWEDSNSHIFCLPSLLAALEIQHQKKEIDALAKTIVGAYLLQNHKSDICSCSRYLEHYYWCASGKEGDAICRCLYNPSLVVPTILYR